MTIQENSFPVEDRCRLVLIIPPLANAAELLGEALAGGDVASIFLPMGDLETGPYQEHVERLTPIAQERGVAVIIERDSQVMGRCGADGLFIPFGLEELKDSVARFSPKRLVGYGGIKSRHEAMEAAEAKADFLFFGKMDGDIKPQAHHKNIELGGWASEVMQISAIVMGGSALESVIEVAEGGTEFVALALAVFADVDGPRDAVAKANALLDAHAPRFSDGA